MKKYHVDSVGGTPLLYHLSKRDASKFSSIEFNGKSCVIKGQDGKDELVITANYEECKVSFESLPDAWPCCMQFPNRELLITVTMRIKDYTVINLNDPVEMTMNEIEEKLGHKVSIVNKPDK